MKNYPLDSIQLARTQQGQVTLLAGEEPRYLFTFQQVSQELTGPEFYRFHEAVVRWTPAMMPVKPIDLTRGSKLRITAADLPESLSTWLSEADNQELKCLLGMAVLMVCTVSRAYNDLN